MPLWCLTLVAERSCSKDWTKPLALLIHQRWHKAFIPFWSLVMTGPGRPNNGSSNSADAFELHLLVAILCRWTGAYAQQAPIRHSLRLPYGKPKGEKPLGRLREFQLINTPAPHLIRPQRPHDHRMGSRRPPNQLPVRQGSGSPRHSTTTLR